MRASRQSNVQRLARAGVTPLADLPNGRSRAFTLVELILVLVLLAIIATFVAARMGAFFQGRSLNFEARRLLSLTHYAQSRAVSEGVPVILWLNPTDLTYGLSIQSTFSDPEGDAKAVRYSLEPNLRLELPQGQTPAVSEQEDERLGITNETLSYIRFTPDGFFDESSVSKITIWDKAQLGLELVPTANRLGYEIRPASNVN